MIYRNKRRAVRALAALRGKATHGRAADYYDHSERHIWANSPEEGIVDLLTDISHLCDAMNLDGAELDSRAYHCYVAEIAAPTE